MGPIELLELLLYGLVVLFLCALGLSPFVALVWYIDDRSTRK